MILNGKQKIFCDKYLIDQNATKAYMEVYKVKNKNVAAVNGKRMLRNAKIKKFIQKKQRELSNKLQLTLEMILEGYRRLAFYDTRKFYGADGNLLKVTSLDDETAFALAGFEVMEEREIDGKGHQSILGHTKKIKTSDRRAALDSICKVLGYNAAEKHDLMGSKIKIKVTRS